MAGGDLPFGFAPSGAMTSYTPTLRDRATDWFRRILFSDDRAGQGRAERVMDVAAFTPFGFGVDMYDAGREAGMGNYGGAALTLGMAGVPGPSPKKIRAFHGSPHDFDRFSMDKIGTGEGNQSFSHGLYFAEVEDIAKGYRDNLSTARSPELMDVIRYAGPDRARNAASMLAADVPEDKILFGLEKLGAENPKASLEAGRAILADAKSKAISGSMYEVEIDADPDAFLDWDKPLSEQPEAVRQALKKLNISTGSMTAKDRVETLEAAMTGDPRLAHLLTDKKINIDGGTLYKKLVEGHHLAVNPPTPFLKSQANVSQKLNQAGIPGVRYLDAGSRGAGDGTRNYVVFDDRLISIVRKYGIAGASAMLGYNILDGMDPAQADELKRIESNQ